MPREAMVFYSGSTVAGEGDFYLNLAQNDRKYSK